MRVRRAASFLVAGVIAFAGGFYWTASMERIGAASCVNNGDVSGCPTVTLEQGLSAEKLVDKVLSGDIVATDVKKVGTVESFSGGKAATGINRGIVLITNGGNENAEKDPDLAKMIADAGNTYGGDTASIEFSITAEGDLLNFDYAFGSREFDQPVQYNDVFALFVSVNGGEYENIALIERSDGNIVPVNIKNLKAGLSGSEIIGENLTMGKTYSLFKARSILVNSASELTNGVSNVFNAQKKVNVGDRIKVKIVIADVGDAAWDSYVFVKGNSLEFGEHGVKVSYLREVLYSLESDTDYDVDDGEHRYKITADENGEIPLVGQDDNNVDYDFFGSGLTIDDGDKVQTIEIASRPAAPDDVSGPTGDPSDYEDKAIQVSEDEIKIVAGVGQEYSLDKIDWEKPNEDGVVEFEDLLPNTEYTVYTRTAATATMPASEPSTGFTIITKNMVRNLEYSVFNYEGEYDGQPHNAYVNTNDQNVDIYYSSDLYGEYHTAKIDFTDPGEYEVYYLLTRDGYYPAYGKLTVKISEPEYPIPTGDVSMSDELTTTTDEDDEIAEPVAEPTEDNDSGLLTPDTGRAFEEMFGAKSGGVGFAMVFAIGLAVSIKLWLPKSRQ